MAEKFTTTILKAEGLNATGISVPPAVIAALGTQKRPKVKVSLNGYTYRTTVAPYGDVFMLPVSQEHRQAAGVNAGDQVEVELEIDTEPRIVEVPDDLAAALAEKPGARAAFDALSYSIRKEHVRQVESSRAQETRDRRIAGIAAKMSDPK
jgi:antitoxin component of MazEF toxin-antitoxin module